jgi:hypothetical protein
VAAEDSELLMEATRLLAKTQRPLLFAAAAEDSGRALAARGRVAPAIEHLNAAFDTYAAHDAAADARRVGRLLRRHGAARRGIHNAFKVTLQRAIVRGLTRAAEGGRS